MKNKNIIKRLNELRNSHIELIDLRNERNYTCGIASNYFELIQRISDLLENLKKAMDGILVESDDFDSGIEYNIADILGIVIKLLPQNEMKFIDEVLVLLDKQEENY